MGAKPAGDPVARGGIRLLRVFLFTTGPRLSKPVCAPQVHHRTGHDKPVSVLLPIEDYEALIETMDLLANPKAMRTLRAAKAGKLKYRALDLDDENFGL